MAVIVPVGAVGRLVEWLGGKDHPSARFRFVAYIPFVLVWGALFAYGAVVLGRPTGSVVFLALAGAMMFEGGRHLFIATRSLFSEPEAEEVLVATGRRRKELEREKASLLKAIKELEFDHQMRKVSDADFAEIGGVYRARAIRVMRQLDDREVDYARLVEEELTRWRKPRRDHVELPKAAAAVQAADAPKAPLATARTCASCGALNDADAMFCKKCAARMEPAA
jgi:hypothetical protein